MYLIYFVTPIALWCLYYVGRGFVLTCLFYKKNGRFMTDEEKKNL